MTEDIRIYEEEQREDDGHRETYLQGDTDAAPEEALMVAWKREGRQHFNHCHKCGRWVSDVMYNADVMECVDCAPWENVPKFCPQCGKRLPSPERFCSKCGAKLLYEGSEFDD